MPGTSNAEEKSIKRIWWSYGKQQTPLDAVARHYIDLNVHVEAENYTNGESIPLRIANDDGTDLATDLPEMSVNVTVGADGTGKVLNVFAGKTVMLGTMG